MDRNKVKKVTHIVILIMLMVDCGSELFGGVGTRNRSSARDQDEGGENVRVVAPAPYWGGMGNWVDPAVSRMQGRIEGLRWLDTQIASLTRQSAASPDDDSKEAFDKQIAALGNQRTKMIELIGQLDDAYGRAVFIGLAGGDAKALQDLPIKGIPEGIGLGLFVRASSACSDALKPRIGDLAENVVGGSWDFIANKLSVGWNSLFHSGNKAFSIKQVEGWQNLVKTCFEDIERLLKDGLKDSLRGQDMTLREPDNTTNEAAKINVWQFLIEGYARQFDYIVVQIDKHLTYYSEEDDEVIIFYAKEIKQRLLEVKSFFLASKSIKELDASLDSNKGLIPALRKNVDNLWVRLLDLIKSQVNQTKTTNSYSSTKNTYSTQRDTGARAGGLDDEEYPRPFHNNGW